MADNQRYFSTGFAVDARPLSDDDRKALNIEDARKDHVGIFHPNTGALLNTMSPADFEQHYTAAAPATAPASAAPATPGASGKASNDPNDKAPKSSPANV